MPVFVNTITPSLSQTDQQLKASFHTTVPSSRNYLTIDYDPRFHFCPPEGGPKKQSESLGSILFGDRIFSSPLSLKMLQAENCQVLCRTTIPGPSDNGESDGKVINELISEGYCMNWLIDGLPAARIRKGPQTNEQFYCVRFELGSMG